VVELSCWKEDALSRSQRMSIELIHKHNYFSRIKGDLPTFSIDI
jgi:hypothetical protein